MIGYALAVAMKVKSRWSLQMEKNPMQKYEKGLAVGNEKESDQELTEFSATSNTVYLNAKAGDIIIIKGDSYRLDMNPKKIDPISQKPLPVLTRVL